MRAACTVTCAALMVAATPSVAARRNIAPAWELQTSRVTARLRGVTAASDTVAWASGANGTIIHTSDGGRTWATEVIPGTDTLDFRDIDAVDDHTAYALSIGAGHASRIYKTIDAGAHWDLQFTNEDPKAFYDAMSFWRRWHGLAISDSVDGQFVILRTEDGSRWSRVPPSGLPAALPNEGAFAGSGTNIAVLPGGRAWIGTGASTKARVLRTEDYGNTWDVAETPIAASASAGIFSVAFRDTLHGMAVGGDYKRESDAAATGAITTDGGVTWTAMPGLRGFRSVVIALPHAEGTWLAAGPTGSEISRDDGRTWAPIEGPGFHTVACAPAGRACWGAGENGRIGRLVP